MRKLAYDFEAIRVLSSSFLERYNRCTRKGTRIDVPDRGLVGVVANKTLPQVPRNLGSRGFDDE